MHMTDNTGHCKPLSGTRSGVETCNILGELSSSRCWNLGLEDTFIAPSLPIWADQAVMPTPRVRRPPPLREEGGA